MSNETQKKQAAARAKRYRENKKKTQHHEVRGLMLHPTVKQKLDEVREFYAYPSEPYDETEAIEACILRAHKDIDLIQQNLGKCPKCNEQLPQGCAKLANGGLFNGEAQCWHTRNRVRLYTPGVKS
ncbi:hypothetical protein [Vibrio cholerae]|uniref:Uncharacterized protein n=1 Tax=Vibrio cholerae TaxID=666 RepID=A0A655URT3_VIBCL|nr:hypothetical protein [Vibrio cholerae]EGR0625744.1 hypothetical protein [Vibrio cholerae]EGR1017309.1 hypothetical protein [Vibrio cholerae]EGR2081285.1 hypothetical protein [Vibrio cholerae]EGR4433877.1 hypothetical protein [Vibrio cholerae]EIF2256596.1 hypothetical protein [Vibrio cholerae]